MFFVLAYHFFTHEDYNTLFMLLSRTSQLE